MVAPIMLAHAGQFAQKNPNTVMGLGIFSFIFLLIVLFGLYKFFTGSGRFSLGSVTGDVISSISQVGNAALVNPIKGIIKLTKKKKTPYQDLCPNENEEYDYSTKSCIPYDVTGLGLTSTSLRIDPQKRMRRFKIKSALQNGLCIGRDNVLRDSMSLVPCDDENSVAYFEEPDSGFGGDGNGSIKAVNFGCFSANNDGKDDRMIFMGGDVPCSLENGRVFKAQPDNAIKNNHNYCVGPISIPVAPGARIFANKCKGQLHQKWIRYEEEAFASQRTTNQSTHEEFKLQTRMGNDLCVGMDNENQKVVMVDCNDTGTESRFQVAKFSKKIGESTNYKKHFINQYNQCLTARNDGRDDWMDWTERGVPCNGQKGKFFSLSGTRLTNSSVGHEMIPMQCADVYQFKNHEGAQLKTHSCNDKANEDFIKIDRRGYNE